MVKKYWFELNETKNGNPENFSGFMEYPAGYLEIYAACSINQNSKVNFGKHMEKKAYKQRIGSDGNSW